PIPPRRAAFRRARRRAETPGRCGPRAPVPPGDSPDRRCQGVCAPRPTGGPCDPHPPRRPPARPPPRPPTTPPPPPPAPPPPRPRRRRASAAGAEPAPPALGARPRRTGPAQAPGGPPPACPDRLDRAATPPSFSARQIPHPDRAVDAAGGELPAVGRRRDPVH